MKEIQDLPEELNVCDKVSPNAGNGTNDLSPQYFLVKCFGDFSQRHVILKQKFHFKQFCYGINILTETNHATGKSSSLLEVEITIQVSVF